MVLLDNKKFIFYPEKRKGGENMIDGKKIIGVCITKIQEVRNINLIDNLHDCAEKNNSKLIIFNSYSDFYTGRKYDDGAKAIYDVINYDVMDAIVIYPMCFCKKEIVQDIIDKAKAHSVPVILIDEEQEGCYSIIADHRNAYKELINLYTLIPKKNIKSNLQSTYC